jgi:hypothetical protein
MRHLPRMLAKKSWLPLALVLGTAAVAAPGTAHAQQMVAFDVVYTAELNDGTVKGETFHHLVKPAADQPANWTTPVNYAKGTAYIHLEVMSKPSARPTIITVCFDGDLEGYGCIDTKSYTTVGVHDTTSAMTSTWQYGKIAWTKKRTEFHLVIKDPALGGTQGGKPASDFVPSVMRIVLTIVPPGGTYVPPAPLATVDGGVAPADAEAPAEPDAAAVAADAAASPVDAGAVAPGAPADAAPAPSTPDAASAPPAKKPDAASKPPTGPATDPGADEEPPAAAAKGCSLGGGARPTAAPLFLVALALGLRRRRARRRF